MSGYSSINPSAFASEVNFPINHSSSTISFLVDVSSRVVFPNNDILLTIAHLLSTEKRPREDDKDDGLEMKGDMKLELDA